MYNFYGPCIAFNSLYVTGLWDGLFCKVFLYIPNPRAIVLMHFQVFYTGLHLWVYVQAYHSKHNIAWFYYLFLC